jgi:hypothetical protein
VKKKKLISLNQTTTELSPTAKLYFSNVNYLKRKAKKYLVLTVSTHSNKGQQGR